MEPFAGSACLFFELKPKNALLADINPDLIDMYREVKHRVGEVVVELQRLECSREDYYRIRRLNPDELTRSKRAARFIYLNRFCFNGLYRTNRAGQFNVPYGALRSGPLPSKQALHASALLLRKASLKAVHFKCVLAEIRHGDFVYMDPPYSVKSRRVFNEYASEQFSDRDLATLRQGMRDLDQRGIRFLVSYADSPEGDFLRQGFECSSIDVRRHIAGFAGNRRDSRELLIFNR